MKFLPCTLFRIIFPITFLTSTLLGGFEIPSTLTEEQAARFKPFESFYIKGVCGEGDYQRLSSYGVNTVRGYSIRSVEEALAELDQAHSLGMKVIVSEWMPNQGENQNGDGSKWNFDYTKGADRLVEKFLEKLEGIGSHPALLMWGLGNEVHLEEHYLRTVNRMSQEIHRRFPQQLTSLTMVNAKPEDIEKIKTFAPDLDVLGIQSYSVGAIRGAIKNVEANWGKPFYFSEFNGKGFWNFKKTDWGTAYDETTPIKLKDLALAYDAIEASSLCLGSTVFLWGYFEINRPTYFSLLLAKDPKKFKKTTPKSDLLMTPRAEYMAERFTGRPFAGNRAPRLTLLAFEGGAKSAVGTAGQDLQLNIGAEDPDGDAVSYKAWILDTKQSRPKVVAGPYKLQATAATVPCPKSAGKYLIMVYALDGNGGASASTIPLLVE